MTDEDRDEFLEKNKDALKGITVRDLLELNYGYPMTSVLMLTMVCGWIFYLGFLAIVFIICIFKLILLFS